MDTDALPTKRNLLQARHNLALARKGFVLLDMKYHALMKELKAVKKAASKLRLELRQILERARYFLALAEMELGPEKFAFFWELSLGGDNSFPPNIIGTCAEFDDTYALHKSATIIIHELIEFEKSIRRLNSKIRSAGRRAAALRNITIPEYERRVKYISEQLDEREADERTRLRVFRK